MKRSKLESYEAILEALVEKPLSVDDIAFTTGIDCTVTNRHISFLLRNELIGERIVDKRRLYALTERGIAVFKTLSFQKYLNKISRKIATIDEAMQTIPIISKSIKQREKH